MDGVRVRSRSRCLLVWVAATVVCGVLGVVLGPGSLGNAASLGNGGRAPAFDGLLVLLCTAALFGCLAWAWLVTTVVVLEAACVGPRTVPVRGHRVPGVPASARRLVLAACGVVLVGGIAAPAMATPGAVQLDPSGDPGRATLTGLPMPERALDAGSPLARAVHGHPGPPGAPSAATVVEPGDSLWSIARGRLPDGADDATVTAEWHRVYELNRDLIGTDPDVIVPSTRLQLP